MQGKHGRGVMLMVVVINETGGSCGLKGQGPRFTHSTRALIHHGSLLTLYK